MLPKLLTNGIACQSRRQSPSPPWPICVGLPRSGAALVSSWEQSIHSGRRPRPIYCRGIFSDSASRGTRPLARKTSTDALSGFGRVGTWPSKSALNIRSCGTMPYWKPTILRSRRCTSFQGSDHRQGLGTRFRARPGHLYAKRRSDQGQVYCQSLAGAFFIGLAIDTLAAVCSR